MSNGKVLTRLHDIVFYSVFTKVAFPPLNVKNVPAQTDYFKCMFKSEFWCIQMHQYNRRDKSGDKEEMFGTEHCLAHSCHRHTLYFLPLNRTISIRGKSQNKMQAITSAILKYIY